MSTRRYRMSSIAKVEQLVRLLDGLGAIDLDDGFRASRPLGYANSHLVDIEHPVDKLPDQLVHALDPQARLEPAA